MLRLERQRRAARGDAVAEAAVDDALARVEDRDRLSLIGDVFELGAHEVREDAAPVCVGSTPTPVTAAASTRAPPGTTMSHGQAAAVPTTSLPSHAPNDRDMR